MSNYWVRIDKGSVIECLSYNPQKEGDWREAIDVPPVLVKNRQITDGHWFDLTKNPVEIRWNVKEVSVEDRRQQILLECISPFLQEVQQEIEKEQNCTSCDSDSGCCTITVTENLNAVKQKRIQILSLSSHEEIDEYMSLNLPE